MRGFFEVGIYHGKTSVNLGTLLRSAYQLGASGVFTIGRRYRRQASDTCKAWRHFPVRHFLTLDDAVAGLPMGCPLIGVEMGGVSLAGFKHPERAAYLLGAEDSGLPESVIARCHDVVSLGSVRLPSFNVAVAGSIVMYDRVFGRAA